MFKLNVYVIIFLRTNKLLEKGVSLISKDFTEMCIFKTHGMQMCQ